MANFHSKILIAQLIAMFFLTGCKDVMDSRVISEGLAEVIDDYTTRYDKDSVILLRFYKIEDRTLLDIAHSPFYWNKEMDGCFNYKNKLVVYYSYVKDSLAESLIDSTFARDKTSLKHYTLFADANCIYDGKPNIEHYLVKSRDCIVKAKEKDLRFKEIVSDTTGIRNESFNNMINQYLNNNSCCITAIRFATFEGENYFIISDIDIYTRKNLSGCLKRNGRIITFYGVENLICPDILDQQLIKGSLPLLDEYKEFSNEEVLFRASVGDIYRFSQEGTVEAVSFENWSEERSDRLYENLEGSSADKNK